MKKAYKIMLICLILAGLVCPGCKPSSNARVEENKALIRRVYEAMDKRDWTKFAEMHSTDFVYHTPDNPKPQTREELLQSVREMAASLPDWHTTIEDIIAEGDKVVTRETLRGTNTGEVSGNPPTGKELTLPLIHIFRIKDGKIAETWEMYNTMSVMQQLGIMPPEG
jgi:steroid delta-isomerase-like uncharacterized protein